MDRPRGTAGAGLLLGLLAATAAAPAHAQLLGQYYPSGIPGYQTWFSDAVLEQPRSEYDALGVRAGSFVVRPELSESLGYNSNIYGLPNAVGATVLGTQASVGVQSDWSRNSLAAVLSVNNQQYLQHSALSYTDWTASLGGTVDVGRDTLTLGYVHLNSTTPPIQIGVLTAGQPITQTTDDARASYQMTLGRFTLEPAVDVAINRFNSIGTGGPNETTNDINTFTGSLTGSYRLAPGSSIVVVANGSLGQFPVRTPGQPGSNYNDVSLVAGVDFHAGALLRYRVTAGYEQLTYVNTQLPGTSAPLVEADAIWTPTRRTTVTVQLSRNLQNAIVPGGSESYVATTAHLSVDHELLRNVLLGAYGQFQTAQYQTSGGTQRVISAGGSVTWMLNRDLSVVGSVTYMQSSDPAQSLLNTSDSVAELTFNFHL